MTLGVYLALMAVLAAPWALGYVTIPWDAKAHFYPQFVFLQKALHAGDSPFWNPHIFAGHPQIADPQSLIFAPVFLTLAALFREPSFALFDAAVFAHLAIGGVGMILYARDRNWREAAALVAALAFAFGGSAIWRVQHVGQVMSLAWLPLAFWAWTRALERGSFKWGLVAGAFAGLMALGRDQVALLGLWTLIGWTLWRWLARHERVGFSWRPLLGGALAGAAIALVPVLMSACFAAMSNRPQIGFAGAGKGSLHPASLLTFFVANIFGVDGPLANFWGPPSQAWGPVNLALARNMAALYQGAIPALLLIAVVFGGGLWRSREARFFMVGLVLSLIYSVGRYTNAWWLIFHLPGADLFRRPADATFLVGFFMALLSGYATHRFIAGPRIGWLRALATLGVLIALGLGMTALAFDKGSWRIAAPALMTASLCYLGAALALYLARRFSREGALGALLAVAAAMGADLMVNNGPNESTALPPQMFAALDPKGGDPLVEAIRRRLDEPAGPDRRDRVELAAIDFHWPNVSMVHGFDGDFGYNPLRLALFTRATDANDHLAIAAQRQWAPMFANYRSPMADLLGLRWIAAGAPLSELDKSSANDAYPMVEEVGRVKLFDRGAPTPRVVLATRALRVDFDEMLEFGEWPVFDPKTDVLLDKSAPAPAMAPREGATGRATLVAYRNAEVEVETNSDSAGWLVLHDVFHPWWAAELDGVEVPLLQANVIFRGVEVPAGAHRVRFVFRPFRGLARDMAVKPLKILDRLVALMDAGIGKPVGKAGDKPGDKPTPAAP